MLRVSAMQIPLAVMIVAIAVLASPLAYGQASGKRQTGTQGTGGRPSGPAVGGGDRTLIPSTEPAVTPPSGALSNLAGGGYADPNYVPLGAPIYIAAADRPEVIGLWVAQDTGGAIKGPNRFDTFWGAGPEAVATAGGMSANGEALILVPKGSASRALPQP